MIDATLPKINLKQSCPTQISLPPTTLSFPEKLSQITIPRCNSDSKRLAKDLGLFEDGAATITPVSDFKLDKAAINSQKSPIGSITTTSIIYPEIFGENDPLDLSDFF
jgi:hypothetical protein